MADAIAVGCVLALMLDRLVLRAWFRRVIDSRWIIPALLLVGLALNARTNTGVVIGVTLTNLAVALVVARWRSPLSRRTRSSNDHGCAGVPDSKLGCFPPTFDHPGRSIRNGQRERGPLTGTPRGDRRSDGIVHA